MRELSGQSLQGLERANARYGCREVVADVGLCPSVAEDTKMNATRIEERDPVPCRCGHGCLWCVSVTVDKDFGRGKRTKMRRTVAAKVKKRPGIAAPAAIASRQRSLAAVEEEVSGCRAAREEELTV